MTSRLEQLIDSRFGLNLAMTLGRIAPPSIGQTIATAAGRLLSSRRSSPTVRAVRANQWVISGCTASREELDLAAREVFTNAGRAIYDLYHYVNQPRLLSGLFVIDPSAEAFAKRPIIAERGLVVISLHMSSFDLALQWICQNFAQPLVLALPNAQGGRRAESEFRRRMGINVVPSDITHLRQAIQYLKDGGMVLTGMDRPGPEYEPRPLFFGRPAALPAHYVYLALKAQAQVMYVVAQTRPDGKCHISATDPIEMDPYPNQVDALRLNAEKLLLVAEEYLRQTPHQWSNFLPVWPEALAEVPG